MLLGLRIAEEIEWSLVRLEEVGGKLLELCADRFQVGSRIRELVEEPLEADSGRQPSLEGALARNGLGSGGRSRLNPGGGRGATRRRRWSRDKAEGSRGDRIGAVFPGSDDRL